MTESHDEPTAASGRSATVVGAGPAGSLMAIYLARQGFEVSVYESRPDLRVTDIDAGRSINLALATRGIVPLIEVGVIDRVDAITIPMRGRMVHAVGDPTPDLQPYGSAAHEVIHSVSRSDLNGILLDAAEAAGATICFEHRVSAIDTEAQRLTFTNDTSASYDVLFGADGVGSPVRAAIAAAGSCEFATEWLDHDYKELTLPPDEHGDHQLDPNALHIWPRGEFMLIALANPEGDFTVTLFAPTTTFAELTDARQVESFFAREFADFVPYIPDLVDQFLENPTGDLGTLRARGWSHNGSAVLVGDSAHGIVPFHGQGMNAAMESARILDRHMRENPGDLAAAFQNYERERKPDADAIADMALSNYVEMRAGVIDPDYVAKRELALELQLRHPRHLSPRYNMVMFSTMPYAEAQERAAQQATIIADAVADPQIDVDALVQALPPLPAPDPLADPKALSTS